MTEIAFDIDGTLIDSWPCIQFGLLHNDGVHVDRSNAYSESQSPPISNYGDLCNRYVIEHSDKTCAIPYAKECIYLARRFGRVVLVTSRDKKYNDATLTTLRRLYGDYPYFINNVSPDEKPEWCVSNKYRFLVDDHPRTATLALSHYRREELTCFMPTWEYNKHVETPWRIDTLEPVALLLRMVLHYD